MTDARTGASGPIVHVVAAGEVGGAERMLARLAAPGAARSGAARPRRHIVALWTDNAALRALFTDAGLQVVSPPRRRGPALSVRLRATGGADVRWLASYLVDQRAAAVQLHTVASHVLGTRAGVQARVPIVRTEHSRRAYDSWLCRPFSAWSLRRATRIVTVSDDLGRLVTARFPALRGRLTRIHNGVPFPAMPAPPPRSTGGPIRFALVARLEPRKAIHRALQAVAAVPGARLDIVGDGPLRADLERIASQLALGDRARFWGYRLDPEAVVAEADATICSSTAEGLPLGLLEAMAHGRAVVAVPVGGIPEMVADGETGWLAARPTVGALTVALRDAVVAGRPELERRGKRARAAVARHFTEEAMRRAYEALYAALPPRM